MAAIGVTLPTAGNGRKGDVANGRFVELQIAEHGFGGTAAIEKTDWPKRVGSGLPKQERAVIGEWPQCGDLDWPFRPMTCRSRHCLDQRLSEEHQPPRKAFFRLSQLRYLAAGLNHCVAGVVAASHVAACTTALPASVPPNSAVPHPGFGFLIRPTQPARRRR